MCTCWGNARWPGRRDSCKRESRIAVSLPPLSAGIDDPGSNAIDEAPGSAKAWVNDQADGNGPKPEPESVRGERLQARVNEVGPATEFGPERVRVNGAEMEPWTEAKRARESEGESARENEEELERESVGERTSGEEQEQAL
jgi:hypothetical protein